MFVVSCVLIVFQAAKLFAEADSNGAGDLPSFAGGVNLPADPNGGGSKVKAAVILVEGMIDDGLFQSIKRRSAEALDAGADYLIFQVSTYGGLVKSADDISKFFILELADRAHTVAYVYTEAISAGSMISVSCEDIIMRENTNIGDCAPIVMGQQLEGVEREKAESFIRATMARAAEANGYPEALLEAMVSVQREVYRVGRLEPNSPEGDVPVEYAFFEKANLPTDANQWDLDNKELIVKEGELLTLTASQAEKYGIARAVVDDIDGVLDFFEARDGVKFEGSPTVYEPNWSEQMVRWINSPSVAGILFALGLLGIYVELNTPGIGLPGLVGVVCFAILFGSKFLIGLANWVELAVFLLGIVLLMIEFFVLPGFGIAGIAGVICLLAGLVGMLIRNPPGELPIPQNPLQWQDLQDGIMGLGLGFVLFLAAAWFLARRLPGMKFASGLFLSPEPAGAGGNNAVMTHSPQTQVSLNVGDVGEVSGPLRPAGEAKFGDAVVDVVSQGQFIEKGQKVRIIKITGNRVIVTDMPREED